MKTSVCVRIIYNDLNLLCYLKKEKIQIKTKNISFEFSTHGKQFFFFCFKKRDTFIQVIFHICLSKLRYSPPEAATGASIAAPFSWFDSSSTFLVSFIAIISSRITVEVSVTCTITFFSFSSFGQLMTTIAASAGFEVTTYSESLATSYFDENKKIKIRSGEKKT